VKQAWYLIARPDGVDQPRTYRMARFKSLRPLDEPASVPPDFDLASYLGNAWGVYRGDRSHDVELRFAPSAALLVTETPWHSTQKVRRHPDGGVTLSFRVDGLKEILHWVLGWSGRVEVLEPDELRLMVIDELQKAIELNRRAGDL
jgi:predicted DNA-binding transcriptional regulator YafY